MSQAVPPTIEFNEGQVVAGTFFGVLGRGLETTASPLRVRTIMKAPKRMLPRAATCALDKVWWR